jgi:hypothetical protein
MVIEVSRGSTHFLQAKTGRIFRLEKTASLKILFNSLFASHLSLDAIQSEIPTASLNKEKNLL